MRCSSYNNADLEEWTVENRTKGKTRQIKKDFGCQED